MTERAAAYEEWARTRLNEFSERVQRRLMLGALVSGVDYVQAVRRRRELRAELQAAMDGLDVVITAGAAGEAPKLDAVARWDVFAAPSFTIPFNVAGYPAIAVCTGFGRPDCRYRCRLSASRFRRRRSSRSPMHTKRQRRIGRAARRWWHDADGTWTI